jgi:hypothetical protein
MDTKVYAKVLVDMFLRELDEAAGIKRGDVPPPPGKSF